MSIAGVDEPGSVCSGAMYSGVPMSSELSVSPSAICSSLMASPKSVIMARGPSRPGAGGSNLTFGPGWRFVN
jgi:hypothetical protein